MRSRSRSISFAILAVVAFASYGRLAAQEPPRSDGGGTRTQATPTGQDTAVEFKRVSFRYDRTVFGNVKSETVPAQRLEERNDKPDGVAPEYVHFTFEHGRLDNDAHVSVYPLNEFPKAYSVNSKLVKSMEENIKGLKEVIKDPSYRLLGQIPHLPFRDASDNFYVRVRQFKFLNGQGILFVTHWTQGAALVSNRNLVYRFEGITDDGKYYVTAETPVTVGFLPFDPPFRFEGFTYEHLFEAYRRPEAKRRYEDYLKSITDRLKKLEPQDFYPNLGKFESIIASLKVGR